jgi:xylulose-5-phosphate/fructose-6-phosphate phosphoketolase
MLRAAPCVLALRRALSHAYGAAFDNPDLIVACVVGDGEAETGPLATGWHGNKFLNPVRDGCVLPILHLNGYKIANPTVLARISHEELEALLRGYGYTPHFVEGDDPAKMHQLLARTLDLVIGEIKAIQADARENGFTNRPPVADDRVPQSQGLDRPEGSRWPED